MQDTHVEFPFLTPWTNESIDFTGKDFPVLHRGVQDKLHEVIPAIFYFFGFAYNVS